MRLIILGALILALISTASAYNINAQGMGIIKSEGDANENTATGHVYMTNGFFDPDNTGLSVNQGSAHFNIGGSLWALGEYGVEVSAMNPQGDTASADFTLIGHTDDSALTLSADATNGIPKSRQDTSVDDLKGTATVHTGASSGDSNADVTTKMTQPDDYDYGYGYLHAVQEATTSQTDIQGAVAAQSSMANTYGSSSTPSIATVRAGSSDAEGSTSTQATVNNGFIYCASEMPIPIYQLAASGTITDDATSLSLKDLGLTDSDSGAVSMNGEQFSTHEFNLEDYRGFSGSIAGGFYETADVQDATFDSVKENGVDENGYYVGISALHGDYAAVTASASNTDAGGSSLDGIETYNGWLGAYGLAAQGTIDGTSAYYAKVPRNNWNPPLAG